MTDVEIIIGAQWGDEGKGKIIDLKAIEKDVIVRFSGGNNAGHTVVNEKGIYKLHIIPSGILYKDKINIIASGCVIDPKDLTKEMIELSSKNIQLDNLFIDERANVILPYHIEQDKLLEQSRGTNNLGTTKKGIGLCYADKYERSGIRMYDFIHEDMFYKKLKNNLEQNNKKIKLLGGTIIDFDKTYDEYSALAKILKPYVKDTTKMLFQYLEMNKKILFEGAQGSFLDIDFGTYPFVTSSHPTAGGACVGAGIAPTSISSVCGVTKAYTTRVGNGPFPTELFDEIGEKICKKGNEYGTNTGRKRRCGWLDILALKFATKINGFSYIAMNKLDVLSSLDTLKICTHYDYHGEKLFSFPSSIEILKECKPVYLEMDGFKEDITNLYSYSNLPKNAKLYIEKIEELTNCPIKIIGVGPNRNQCLFK